MAVASLRGGLARRTAFLIGLATVTACALTACGSSGSGSAPARHSGTAAAGRAAPAPTTPVEARPAVTARAAKPAVAAAPRTVAANPCAPNRSARQVRVSLHAQRLWLCERTHVVYDTAITSGMSGPDTATPTGNYHIQGLNRNSTLTLNTGRTYDVKYWIPFNAPLFGFHDSPWQKFPYGSPQYRTDGSHGCIHMPLAAIKHLYGWADIGTKVHIAR